jgi:hypothetical protein
MRISPQLLRKLRETLGADAADDLVSRLEDMARIDSSFERLEAKMEALMENCLRKQAQYFFLAWSVLLAAIVGLYAR